MKKFKLSELKKHSETVRTCFAPYHLITREGTKEVEEVEVIYRDLSLAEVREQQKRVKAANVDDDVQLKRLFEKTRNSNGDFSYKEFKEELENSQDTFFISDILQPVIMQLPWLVDEKDKPVDITVENLDQISSKNLQSIFDSIQEDRDPKLTRRKSRSGSKRTAS